MINGNKSTRRDVQ